MQEQMNKAMAQLRRPSATTCPRSTRCSDKIEARYAKAKASSELQETSVETRILEVEQATANVEAHSRLSQLRAELGLDAPATAPRRRRRSTADRAAQARRRLNPLRVCAARRAATRVVVRCLPAADA